ncbi:MAG: isochorismate synthase, partial [Blastococcus sp.]|nr:isochorismate synthase [Blastococcus sp.]
MTTVALTTPAAAARTVTTVRTDDAGDLLELLPEGAGLSWVRRGDGLVGWGEAARLEV